MIKYEIEITEDTQILPGDIITNKADWKLTVWMASSEGIITSGWLTYESAPKREGTLFFIPKSDLYNNHRATIQVELEDEYDLSRIRRGDILIDKEDETYRKVLNVGEYLIHLTLPLDTPEEAAILKRYHWTITKDRLIDFKLYTLNQKNTNTELTLEQIATKFDIPVKELRIRED